MVIGQGMTKNIHEKQNFGNLTDSKDRDTKKYSYVEPTQNSVEDFERARLNAESGQSRE